MEFGGGPFDWAFHGKTAEQTILCHRSLEFPGKASMHSLNELSSSCGSAAFATPSGMF